MLAQLSILVYAGMKTMQMQTEKHVAYLENINLDMNLVVFLESECMSEALQNLPVELSQLKESNAEMIQTFWMPAEDPNIVMHPPTSSCQIAVTR